MFRSRTVKSAFTILAALVVTVSCAPLTIQIPASALPSTLSVSPSPTHSMMATRTSVPMHVLTGTQLQTIEASTTKTLEISITKTAVSPTKCPLIKNGVAPIEVHHPSNDYSTKIANYLNAGGAGENLGQMLNQLQFVEDDIVWHAQAHLFIADVTGDTTPDVVLDLVFFADDSPVLGSGYVFYCKDGQYEGGVIANLSFSAYFKDPALNNTIGLRALPDMNLNGIPEIVFSSVMINDGILSISPTTDYARWFQIIEWNGSAFVDLPIRAAYGSNALVVVNGDGRFADTNSDSYVEFILEGGSLKEVGHGHRFFRATNETWEWNGDNLTLSCMSFSPPMYRFQAVEDGDAAFLCQDYSNALSSYQRAIFDQSLAAWSQEFQFMLPGEPTTGPTSVPDPEEWPLLSAYARYRIMLIHMINEEHESASIVYETLISNFPETSIGHQYAELATVVWEEYIKSRDLSEACRKGINLAASREDLVPISRRYTYYSILYLPPNQLCPFN